MSKFRKGDKVRFSLQPQCQSEPMVIARLRIPFNNLTVYRVVGDPRWYDEAELILDERWLEEGKVLGEFILRNDPMYGETTPKRGDVGSPIGGTGTIIREAKLPDPVSVTCRKTHFQDCSHCDDIDCCDNTSQAKRRIEELERENIILRKMVVDFANGRRKRWSEDTYGVFGATFDGELFNVVFACQDGCLQIGSIPEDAKYIGQGTYARVKLDGVQALGPLETVYTFWWSDTVEKQRKEDRGC